MNPLLAAFAWTIAAAQSILQLQPILFVSQRVSRREDLKAKQSDHPKQQQIDQVFRYLTEEEVEVAARTSYQYFLAITTTRNQAEIAMRQDYAKMYIKLCLNHNTTTSHHTNNCGGNVKQAVARVKETLRFRTRVDVDRLRISFDKQNKCPHYYAKQLERQIRSKNVYVQGHDRQGRSTYIFVPRNVQFYDKEWTIKQHIYTLERAVACSRAPDKTVNAVVDFKGFEKKGQKPSMDMSKEFMATFCKHYSGFINRVYLIDAPPSFLLLWTVLVKPLLGKRVGQKIRFVSSQHPTNELSELYDTNEAAAWMTRGGKKNRELDIDEYLYKTPFHRAFDE